MCRQVPTDRKNDSRRVNTGKLPRVNTKRSQAQTGVLTTCSTLSRTLRSPSDELTAMDAVAGVPFDSVSQDPVFSWRAAVSPNPVRSRHGRNNPQTFWNVSRDVPFFYWRGRCAAPLIAHASWFGLVELDGSRHEAAPAPPAVGSRRPRDRVTPPAHGDVESSTSFERTTLRGRSFFSGRGQGVGRADR